MCAGLGGEILEIGFGSGANVEHLPAAVRRVWAVEPDAVARHLSERARTNSDVEVTFVDSRPDVWAIPDGSLDAALCTFTLCTVERPEVVLAEIRRILKPGAPLHFLEHGLSPDRRMAAWQHRLNGWERRLAGGCQLIRDPLELIAAASLDLQWSEQSYALTPSPWSFMTLGVARTPPG